jgi:hypothetical protein
VTAPAPVVDVAPPVPVQDHAQPTSGGTAAPDEAEPPAVESGITGEPVAGEIPHQPTVAPADGETAPPAVEEPPPVGTTPLPTQH